MPKYEIVIDYEDWYIFFTSQGVEIQSKDDVAELSETYTTTELAKMLIAGQEQGSIAEDIVKCGNKMNLLYGMRSQVNGILAQRLAKTELENGKEITIRERVGHPANGHDGGGREFKRWDDPATVSLLDRYIFNNAVGHVVGRLRQLAPIVGKKGVMERVRDYKAAVDEAVEEVFGKEPEAV